MAEEGSGEGEGGPPPERWDGDTIQASFRKLAALASSSQHPITPPNTMTTISSGDSAAMVEKPSNNPKPTLTPITTTTVPSQNPTTKTKNPNPTASRHNVTSAAASTLPTPQQPAEPHSLAQRLPSPPQQTTPFDEEKAAQLPTPQNQNPNPVTNLSATPATTVSSATAQPDSKQTKAKVTPPRTATTHQPGTPAENPLMNNPQQKLKTLKNPTLKTTLLPPSPLLQRHL